MSELPWILTTISVVACFLLWSHGKSLARKVEEARTKAEEYRLRAENAEVHIETITKKFKKLASNRNRTDEPTDRVRDEYTIPDFIGKS